MGHFSVRRSWWRVQTAVKQWENWADISCLWKTVKMVTVDNRKDQRCEPVWIGTLCHRCESCHQLLCSDSTFAQSWVHLISVCKHEYSYFSVIFKTKKNENFSQRNCLWRKKTENFSQWIFLPLQYLAPWRGGGQEWLPHSSEK